VLLSALAAAAVDFGFGVNFVRDAVAYSIVLYVCGLAALLLHVQRDSNRTALLLRLPVALAAGAFCLWSLRGWARIPLDIGHGTTAGHWPYLVIPAATLLASAASELGVLAYARRGETKPQPDA
jgi:hypothetical protein